MRLSRLLLKCLPAVLLLTIVGAVLWKDLALARPAQALQVPVGETVSDPIALLQKKLESGRIKLAYIPVQGYLQSVLKELGIPVSSQTLVFSRTSLQIDRISPETPRALYFNDDVYVAWAPGSPVLEVASTDPRYGLVFYALAQTTTKSPSFQRQELPCTSCHAPTRVDVPAPLLLMMSVASGESGESLGPIRATTDRSPFSERWGGWYVTGMLGDARHMGRKISFDTSPYLTPYSDIVALLLLAHQSDVHNRISEASHRARVLGSNGLEEAAEPLVRALLFSGAVPFPSPIRGTSGFATEFARKGPRDSRGRSLRDMDLNRRLFQYPLSYLIYSESFRQMPETVRTYVYRRLREVLTGKDQSEDFRHLSNSDRTAILEILTATMAEFARSASRTGQ